MATYLVRRVLLMIPTLIGITFLVFMLVALAPGGIGAALKAQGGQMQSQASVALLQAYLEDRYGLDDPVVVQYGRWLGRISPIKFGTRDLVSPSGDRVRPPKRLKEPPLWQWFTGSLPPAPPATLSPPDKPEQRAEVFRRAERLYADARSAYIAASTAQRQALGAHAKSRGIPGGTDPKGAARIDVLHRAGPDPSAPDWPEQVKAAERTLAAYSAALQTRANLAAAFAARPYPQAGVAIIPGVVSIAMPDFGIAYSRGTPVISMIEKALPVTILLNLVAFPIIYAVAIPGGMLAATHRGSLLDTGMGAIFIALWSVPTVLGGVLCIGFLANKEFLGAFPVSNLHASGAETMRYLPGTGEDGTWSPGYILDTLWHMCLPVLCLVYTGFAVLSKQCRAAMLDNFNADYVRTAKAKGVPGRDIVLRHVFRNSLLPLITLFVTIFPAMLAGSVVIERIFSVPGMGKLILQAIELRDRELLLANTLMIAAVNLLALLLADILYALADPRVTYS